MSRGKLIAIHVVLISVAALTLVPFAFMVNNVFRSNTEFYHDFFSIPEALKGLARAAVADSDETVEIEDDEGRASDVSRSEAAGHYADRAVRGPMMAWEVPDSVTGGQLRVRGLPSATRVVDGTG